MRDAPWIVERSLELGMEAEGHYAPRPPHGPNIWQAFDATSRRCVEHTGLEACRCARRPGWLNAAWSFEWKLRGATRPDCHKVLAFGVRFMPRDIQFRFFLPQIAEPSLKFCVEAKGRCAPRLPQDASIWGSFHATGDSISFFFPFEVGVVSSKAC